MSNALVWTVLGTVIGGYLGKQVLSWFNQGRYAPAIDLTVAISVFVAIATLIVKGIKTAADVLNAIPMK